MGPADLAAVMNPRVISCLPSAAAEGEMRLAGVATDGVRIMGAKSAFLVVRLDGVDLRLAQKVKSIMLSLGADAAIEESAWAGAAKTTPLIVMGTRRQFKDMLKSLSAEAPDAQALGQAVGGALDNFHRTEFALRAGDTVLKLSPGKPLLAGIVNVTPDSFSDGGKYADPEAAIARGVEMAGEGAGIIDVGGESTRPGSLPVDAEEEKRRVTPVIRALAKQVKCPISVDTSKAEVAEEALDAGASIINDITALSGDPAMAPLAAGKGCPVFLMHMKGTPRTMQKAPFYRDLMGEVVGYLRAAVERAVAAGVDREQTVVDPGIGFGKTAAHNLELLRRLRELGCLGRPVLVGVSRKSFIGTITGAPAERRAFGTAAAVALAVASGAHIMRVHDVGQMREAAAVAAAIATGNFEEVG